MNINLIYITENCEKIIEKAARVAYKSDAKINNNSHIKFLNNLLKSGHLSVFEHATASFIIDGISRACSHQLVRHRLASYTQQSQRYVSEDNFNYVIPDSIKENRDALSIYENTMSIIKENYKKLLQMNILKEDARFILPNSTTTTIFMTANFREWLHIIDLRVSKEAQWEIRNLLTLIWKELYKKAPNVFDLTYFEKNTENFEFKKNIFYNNVKGER